MQIFVKMWTGKTVVLDVEATDTIEEVKKLLPNRYGVLMRMIFAGKQLENWGTLAHYKVTPEATLQLV